VSLIAIESHSSRKGVIRRLAPNLVESFDLRAVCPPVLNALAAPAPNRDDNVICAVSLAGLTPQRQERGKAVRIGRRGGDLT
jgi:hypothetical protein